MKSDVSSSRAKKRRLDGAAPRQSRTPQPSAGAGRRPAKAPAPTPQVGGIRPWHMLVLGVAMAGLTAVVVTRGSSVINTVFVTLAVGAGALVAAAMYRSLVPFAAPEMGERTDMLGGRTRAALEREKMLVLRSIKEVEFDRAMRKVSEGDYQELVARLRVRAAGLIRQLDAGGGYRELIERDLASRLRVPAGGASAPSAVLEADEPSAGVDADDEPVDAATPECRECGATNDSDARFCKSCGARLARAE